MPLRETRHIAKFPYLGEFFTYEIDMNAPLDKREPKENIVFKTICDIQHASKMHNGIALNMDYTIYWPLERNEESTCTVDYYKDILVRRGMRFRGIFYGYEVVGEVENVRPSQLGQASCDIKVVTESNTDGKIGRFTTQ